MTTVEDVQTEIDRSLRDHEHKEHGQENDLSIIRVEDRIWLADCASVGLRACRSTRASDGDRRPMHRKQCAGVIDYTTRK